MAEGNEGRRDLFRKSRAVFEYSCNPYTEDQTRFVRFEETRIAAFCGAAYPGEGSRGPAACKRALDTAADCFFDRPSSSDTAVETLGRMINDEVSSLQEKDRAFLCSAAFLYLFKGRARAYAAGHSLIMCFDDGDLKSVYRGNGVLLGSTGDGGRDFPEEIILDRNLRFLLIAAENGELPDELSDLFERQSGMNTEEIIVTVRDRRCACVNLYLPLREKKGFFR